MEMNARELSRLLELNKKKAELEFQRSVLGMKPDSDLSRVSSSVAELSAKARSAGIEVVYPEQKRLDELAKEVDEFPTDALREGLKIKDGKAYQVLKDRGMIIKRNFQNRSEIAKLLILASKMGNEEKGSLLGVIASGALAERLTASSIPEEERKRLARVLRRCGILCQVDGEGLEPVLEGVVEKELILEMSNRSVWVTEEAKPVLEANLKRIGALNAKIQLKNAERQVKLFSQAEEDDFATMQMEYLDLLKQQDGILKDYLEEDKISAKQG
jgi:hypothetical protein